MSNTCNLMSHLPRVRVGGIVMTALSRAAWANKMKDICLVARGKKERPIVVFSANGQTLATYYRDKAFKALFAEADAVDADGQPAVIASRILTKTPLPERVATTDFFHNAASMAQESGLSFYFLAASQKNIEIAIHEIKLLYPKLNIVGYRNGYFTQEEEPAIAAEIVRLKSDVLWVGMGVPRQEDFVIRNLDALRGVGWVKTCGGLFDYFLNDVKRAPLWMHQLCLEWLFRMCQEPGKFARRYITTNGLALWLLITKTNDL